MRVLFPSAVVANDHLCSPQIKIIVGVVAVVVAMYIIIPTTLALT